jgi:hypothetical protein
MPSSRQTARKNFAANCAPLSVRIYRGGPYENTQALQNSFATLSAVIVLSGPVRVNFENRSVITNKNLFPCSFLGRGPRMSMDTYSHGDDVGKNFRKEVRLRSLTRFFAQMGHWQIVSDTSAAICFQKNRLRIDLNILVILGCPTTLGKCPKWRSSGRRTAGITICLDPSKGALRTSSP